MGGIKNDVTVQDEPSSCPAKLNKKHRRFLRCEIWLENPLTSKLDTDFPRRFSRRPEQLVTKLRFFNRLCHLTQPFFFFIIQIRTDFFINLCMVFI